MERTKKRHRIAKTISGLILLGLVLFGASFLYFEMEVRDKYVEEKPTAVIEDANDHDIPFDRGVKYKVKVKQGIDGNSFIAEYEGEDIEINMLYTKAPTSGEYQANSAQYLNDMLLYFSKVEIEIDQDTKTLLYDNEGKLNAWVFGDGVLMQLLMTQDGLVEKLDDKGYNYTYKTELDAAQQEAIANKIGVHGEY